MQFLLACRKATRRAKTKRTSRAPPGLRHAAAGLEASDAPPPFPHTGAPTPPRIRAATALSVQQRCRAPTAPGKEPHPCNRASLRGRRARASTCASRRPCLPPGQVCHAGAHNTRALVSPQACASARTATAFRCRHCRPEIRRSVLRPRPTPEGPRRHANSAPRQRRASAVTHLA